MHDLVCQMHSLIICAVETHVLCYLTVIKAPLYVKYFDPRKKLLDKILSIYFDTVTFSMLRFLYQVGVGHTPFH
jgi:hypothetical protein